MISAFTIDETRISSGGSKNEIISDEITTQRLLHFKGDATGKKKDVKAEIEIVAWKRSLKELQ
jgi:hypothetical protein